MRTIRFQHVTAKPRTVREPGDQVFEGIRFVDRFEVAGGRITRQDVWNDLAESL